MDDEKYFTFSDTNSPENSGIWADNFNEAPDNFKYKPKSKFLKKVLVWVAISDRGISDLYIIRSSSVSINQQNYLTECIRKRLLKFIKEKHADVPHIFWPDSASTHYAKSVVEMMDQEGVKYVPKKNNPPNSPQARPIENFWSILSGKVYAGEWEAKSVNQLIRRIFFCLRTLQLSLIKSLMSNTQAKVRCLFESGPLTEKIIN
ncbi:uncharacterized protein LOC141856241 [Brevipalpus obovatus]|uniref:uncharacterized protein LOC141856241 n=1 Tax=Brevipalpus obovatus TaxID=246614 RepID=UPI003D9F4F8D